MFTSKLQLSEGMGVDPAIAEFFVDRPVPKNNAYWKGRYLYVAKGTGYLFIPLFFDLQHKAGIELKHLLNKDYVVLMENILNLAGEYEFGGMDFKTHIQQIDELSAGKCLHPVLLEQLRVYFDKNPQVPQGNLGLQNAALNRGDALLYLLTNLPATEPEIDTIIGYWYLLVPTFLLMDDIMDLHEDQEKQEENSLAHFGYNPEGVKKALSYLEKSFSKLEAVNPKLGAFFQNALNQKKETPYFKYVLNE